eukprot:TRINITY_DN57078_c0_g1_i1.p1 TRINITY_DN57078_c0_g1~~TRINITY_DN57078_c0_g1_i1.p1  ORF type:complete len:547 (-),score=71.01 TRINITY_DN57078_c0_g1_i1:376-1965(-)
MSDWLGADLYMGWIKHADPTKTHCWFECPDYGADVQMHVSVVEFGSISPLDTLAFKIHVSPKGVPQASAPVWKLAGSEEGAPRYFGDFLGKVGPITSKGNSWLESPQAEAVHGSAPWVHQSVIQQCGLWPGCVIAFSAHLNKSGMPQVTAPVWICCSAEKWVPELGTGNPSKTPRALMPSEENRKRKQPEGSGGNEVAAWSARRSPVGAKVQISVGGTMRLNQPEKEATIEISAGGTARLKRPKPSQDGVPVPTSSEKWKKSPPEASSKTDTERFFGRVVSTQPEKGLSWVACLDSDSTQDVQVHHTVADPSCLAADDMVCFSNIHVNSRGHSQASAPFWKLACWAQEDFQKQFPDYEGRVSIITPTGQAFVESIKAEAAFGCSPLIHGQIVKRCGLSMGSVVAFNVYTDDSATPQASAPFWVCLSPNRWASEGTEAKQSGGPNKDALAALADSAAVGSVGHVAPRPRPLLPVTPRAKPVPARKVVPPTRQIAATPSLEDIEKAVQMGMEGQSVENMLDAYISNTVQNE